MRATAALGILLSASSISFAATPFDRYIAEIKTYHSSESLKKFTASCGVTNQQSLARFAASAGTWAVTEDLPKSVFELETDYFSTVEILGSRDGGTAIDLWSVDLDQDVNSVLCFDVKGHLRFLESTYWSFADTGSQKVAWIYKQKRELTSSGELLARSGEFEDAQGRKIASPNLSKKEKENLDWVPAKQLSGLQLPQAILK